MPVHGLNLKVNLSYGDDYLQDKEGGDSARLMFVFWGIIVPIIAVIGFIGNLLTIIVLFRMDMKSTTIYFLRTLVVTDTAIILGAVLGLSTIAITQLNPDMWLFNDVIYPHIYTPTNYVVMTLQMINVWVTVAVSLERYLAICHPFRSVNICNKRNAIILIIIVTIVSVLYNIPRFFATSYSECKDKHECFAIVTTAFGKGHFYDKIYSVWLYMLLIYIIPLVVLSLLNTLLIVELMRMRNRRTVSNVQENSEANMTIVLLLIVVVFIICQTPGLVAQFQFLTPDVMLQWLCVSNTLFVLNSSVNFLIYTAVGRKFRKVLLKTFQVLIKRPITDFNKSTYSHNGATEMDKLNKVTGDSDEVSDEKCRFKVCR